MQPSLWVVSELRCWLEACDAGLNDSGEMEMESILLMESFR